MEPHVLYKADDYMRERSEDNEDAMEYIEEENEIKGDVAIINPRDEIEIINPKDDDNVVRDTPFYQGLYEDETDKEKIMKSMELMKSLKSQKEKTTMLWLLACICAIVLILLVVFIVLYARKAPMRHPPKFTQERQESEYCTDENCVVIASRMIEAMNISADPCHDFYNYACGNWIAKTLIPDYDVSIGRFLERSEKNEIVVKQILDDLMSEKFNALTMPLRKTVAYYKSCLNVRQIERIGDKHMKEYVKKLGSWPVADPNFNSSNWNLMEALVLANNEIGVQPLFSLSVVSDIKNRNATLMAFDQSGLGMSITYYLSNKTRHLNKRDAYVKLMKAIATQMGSKESGLKLLDQVFELETQLARLMTTERRIDVAYRSMTLGEFINRTEIPKEWLLEFVQRTVLLGKRNVSLNERIISYSAEYIKNAFKLFTGLRVEVQASYVVWRAVKFMSSILASMPPYTEIWKDYQGLSELRGERPRWRTCVRYTNSILGYALSALFVERTFDEAAKEMSREIIEGVKVAFEVNIETMDWIDEETKEYAKKKAYAIIDNIGYPGMIFNDTKLERKYADLTVYKGEYFLNVMEKIKYLTKKDYLKLGRPVDKAAWTDLPIQTNAYYLAAKNKITFPAGVLQWPFYDTRAPRAVSYGAVGMIVGHEISHGFDAHGKNYNIEGNYEEWWTEESSEAFQNKSECFVQQYSNFSMMGEQPNGWNTLSEDIADNGGIRRGLEAYSLWVEKNGGEKKLVGLDLNPEQLFFLSFAQMWCQIYRKAGVIWMMENASHSLSSFRVRAVLGNYEEFSKVYNCPVGSPMNPKRKCRIW